MLSFATSHDIDEARDLKELGKGVLREIVGAIEASGCEEAPSSVGGEFRGRRLAWRLSGLPAPPCRECACDGLAYEPERAGLSLEFCPACWRLRGNDPARGTSFDVTAGLAKRMRDLPPGMTAKPRLRGEEIEPRDPPPPESEAERKAAFEAYAASARRRFEIGRQVWMGQLAFQGFDGAPPDYAAARRWLERAARWGSGEALALLGLMALHGLGEPVDTAKAVSLCRRGAERGYAEAQTGMGLLCWDGTGVPRDEAAAVAWWKLAAARGDAEARRLLAEALEREPG